ncbi:unnamed protein product, partial [marine sediment metagenome]
SYYEGQPFGVVLYEKILNINDLIGIRKKRRKK